MCDNMPAGKECLCCEELNKLDWMLRTLRCITQHEDFASLCLNSTQEEMAGVGVRRVIPARVVTFIRMHFPEETAEYVECQESNDGPQWSV